MGTYSFDLINGPALARIAAEETEARRAEVVRRLERSQARTSRSAELAAKSRAAIIRSNELLAKSAMQSLYIHLASDKSSSPQE